MVGLFSDFSGTHVDRIVLEHRLGRALGFVVVSEAAWHVRWILQEEFGYAGLALSS